VEREKKRVGSGNEFLSGGWYIVGSDLFDATGVCVVSGVAVAVFLI